MSYSNVSTFKHSIKRFWFSSLMRYAGLSPVGRVFAFLATWTSKPYKNRMFLSRLNTQGYISPYAHVQHNDVHFDENVFIAEGVVIYQSKSGGLVKIGRKTCIHRDSIIETGNGGKLIIGSDTHIQPRCQLSAYTGKIEIGNRVQIAPNCGIYPYNHSFSADKKIIDQPFYSKGGIRIEDDVWIGFGVVILDNVRIGKGAVVGAGSVVTHNILDNAIAVGNPARVIKFRNVEK